VVGVDEAGRGPLAGPVVAGAARIDLDAIPQGLDDSKRLSPHARAALFPRILNTAAVGVGIVTAEEIDGSNIREASRRAMIAALRMIDVSPDWVLVDGTRFAEFPHPQIAVVRGDSLVPSIAAASIVAKIVRDRLMECYHRIFPVYRFDEHKGYPTEAHARAIAEHGRSRIHRSSFHVPAPRLPLEEKTK